MRVFRDRRADSDRSLRLGWTIFVWLMTRQLVSDVDLVEQAELDRLEGLPPCLPGHGLSFGTCDVSVDHVFGDQVPIFVKIVIYVENYPQKRCFRLAYYHPPLWGGGC